MDFPKKDLYINFKILSCPIYYRKNKVMFLHLSVNHSVHGGGVVCDGGKHGRGCAWQGVVCGRGLYVAGGCMWQGTCVGGHAWQGGVWWGGGMRGKGTVCAGETATEAGGMHPTGKHSCFETFLLEIKIKI